MDIIKNVGEIVTVRAISNTINDYGDSTTSVAGSSFLSGLIVPMYADSREVKLGILDMEDAIGIFDNTATSVKNGNEVYCTLGSFGLQNVQQFTIGSVVNHIESELKRVTT